MLHFIYLTLTCAGVRGPLSAAAAIVLLSSMGCGRNQRAEQPDKPRPRQEKMASVAGIETELSEVQADVNANSLRLPGTKAIDATDAGDWDSEQVATLASAALNHLLSHSLATGRQAVPQTAEASSNIETIASNQVQVQPLKPAELVEVFTDGRFAVRRWSGKVREVAAQPGVSALRDELANLGRFQDDVAAQRFEQKIVHVRLDESQVTTRSIVHLVGRSPTSGTQINAHWECNWQRHGDTIRLHSIMATEYEEVTVTGPTFSDCTESVVGGSDYYQRILAYGTDHWLDRLETRFGLDPAAWQGIAVADVDGDGLEDVYVSQPGGIPNGLLRQRADGTVTNIADKAGVNLYDQTQSALLIDVDNDGDQDLVVAISMGLTFFANDGRGRFTMRSAKLIPQGIPYSLAAADYDLDGKLDIYACCYSKRKSEVDHRFMGRPIPYHDANNGARNVLFRNLGSWQFQDVTQRVGLSQNNSRFSFAASWEDYDNDGDADLYVANDYGRNNLYRNNDGVFVDVASQAGVEDMSAGMSVSWGDVDNDGWMDLYVSNMFSSAGNRIAYQRRFKDGADASTLAGYQRHARGNSLFMNDGTGKFRDESVAANVTMGRWAWGSSFFDINNDGRKDILVTNGFLTQEKPVDL